MGMRSFCPKLILRMKQKMIEENIPIIDILN